MKRTLLILIVSLGCVGLKAQTKEQTVGFIAKCMKEAEGLKTYGVRTDGSRVSESINEKNEFELTKIFTQVAIYEYAKGTYTQNSTSTNMVWANVISIALDTLPSLGHDDEVAIISFRFSTKLKETQLCESGTFNVSCGNTYYWDSLNLIIPRNRAVACKKAFDHLVKLCKEENKSPFDN